MKPPPWVFSGVGGGGLCSGSSDLKQPHPLEAASGMGSVSMRATFWWSVLCYKWQEKPQKKSHPLVVVVEEVRGVCST